MPLTGTTPGGRGRRNRPVLPSGGGRGAPELEFTSRVASGRRLGCERKGHRVHLEVKHLSKTFQLRSGFLGRATPLAAVSDVNLEVRARGSVAIVGETGSGKTTVARMVVGLETPTSGEILA